MSTVFSVNELRLGSQSVRASQTLCYLTFFFSKAPSEAENNLIDLRPSTPPAVRQPEVTNNLSSQLAGMSMLPRSILLNLSPVLL